MRGVRNLIIALVFSLVMPVTAFGNGVSCLDQATLRSTAAGRPAIITFVNNSTHAANIYWIDYGGKRAQQFYVTPSSVISRNTLVTHPWVITDDYDNCIGVAFANPSAPNVEITDSGIVFSSTSGPVLADNPAYAKHGDDEAGESTAFCAAAKKPVDADPRLAAEVAAVFGKATFKATGEDCLYPLQVLRYASADVLVFQAGEPGGRCHGCGAPLSAYVVRRVNGGFKTVRRYRQFATLGTFGAVGDISAIEIGGDDGMAIESGGMFQGYAFTAVDFYAFHAGQLVSLNTTPIFIAADNSGAMADPSKAIEVTATWFFNSADKTALVVDYKVRAHDAARVERAVWRLQGRSLVLSRGRVPPEVSAAAP